MRLGSAGDPFRWYISQPGKCGPLTAHVWRLPSDVRMNAPLRVPTSTLTLLISTVLRRGHTAPYPFVVPEQRKSTRLGPLDLGPWTLRLEGLRPKGLRPKAS